MARAHRHYLPGQNWHLNHRHHERRFLLEFLRDRQAWMGWLSASFAKSVDNKCPMSVPRMSCSKARYWIIDYGRLMELMGVRRLDQLH